MNSARVWRSVRAIVAPLAPLALMMLVPSAAWAGDLGVCASSVSGHGVLSDLAQQFQLATGPWATAALGYARGMFFALVGIELAWSGITYILQKDSLPDFIAALLLKLLSVGFFFILLQPEYGPAWIGDVTASFMQAGSAIGGQPAFGPSDPSAIFNCGTDIAGAMMGSLSHRGFSVDLLGLLEAYLTALLCAIGVMLGFAVAAGQLLMTLIESYIVVGGGLFLLGFSGSRWTLVFAEKYLGYVWSVGIKLFMLELIVGLGYGLGQQWAALFVEDSVPPGTYIEVLGAALVFGFLAWQIPGLAASLMNGSPRMTLGAFLSNVGTTMVGGAIAASGAIGAVSGAAAFAGKSLEAVRQAGAAAQGAAEAGGAGAGASAGSAAADFGGAGGGADFAGTGRARTSVASGVDEEPVGDEPGDGPDAAASPHEERPESSPDARGPGSDPLGDDSPDDGGSGDVGSGDGGSSTEGDEPEPDAMPTGDRPDDPPPDRGGKPRKPSGGARGFRAPPIPDDAADGSIHIRFKHPE